MVTNDERRRVVTALRSADMFSGLTFGCRWAELIFGEKPKCVEQRLRCSDCAIRALQYLADLIDPGSECDRDALLALADEMDTVAASKETYMVPYWYLDNYAERIREALGVETS